MSGAAILFDSALVCCALHEKHLNKEIWEVQRVLNVICMYGRRPACLPIRHGFPVTTCSHPCSACSALCAAPCAQQAKKKPAQPHWFNPAQAAATERAAGQEEEAGAAAGAAGSSRRAARGAGRKQQRPKQQQQKPPAQQHKQQQAKRAPARPAMNSRCVCTARTRARACARMYVLPARARQCQQRPCSLEAG